MWRVAHGQVRNNQAMVTRDTGDSRPRLRHCGTPGGVNCLVANMKQGKFVQRSSFHSSRGGLGNTKSHSLRLEVLRSRCQREERLATVLWHGPKLPKFSV